MRLALVGLGVAGLGCWFPAPPGPGPVAGLLRIAPPGATVTPGTAPSPDSLVVDGQYTVTPGDAWGSPDSVRFKLLAPALVTDTARWTVRPPFAGSFQIRRAITAAAPPTGTTSYTVMVCGIVWRRGQQSSEACSNPVELAVPPPGPLEGIVIQARRVPGV